MAGKRQISFDAASLSMGLHFCLLCHLQCIIDLDAKVSDCTFKLSVYAQVATVQLGDSLSFDKSALLWFASMSGFHRRPDQDQS